MNIDFSNKVAVVTGGSSGIGLAVVKLLLKEGCFVYLISKDKIKQRLLIKELTMIYPNVCGFCANVNDSQKGREIISKIKKKHSNVDFLINCAGISLRKLPQDTDLLEWELVLKTNLTSVFMFSTLLFPLLKRSDGYSKIINIGSMTSIFGADIACAYSASKGAIVQFSKSLALAWANDNILVNTVIPGWVDTELTKNGKQEHPEFYSKIDGRIPLKRWAEPEDIANVIAMMLSDYNNYMTGSSIIVDGGFSSSLM